ILSQQFRGRVAENLLRRWIQIAEFAVLMDEDNGGERLGEREKLPFGLARRTLSAPSIGYLQGVADGRHQAVQPVLEDIIGGSTGQGVNGQFFPADPR